MPLTGGAKNSGGIRQAYDQSQVSTGTAGRIGSWFWVGEHTGARPVDLHGHLPGWSDSQAPALEVTGDLPVFP